MNRKPARRLFQRHCQDRHRLVLCHKKHSHRFFFTLSGSVIFVSEVHLSNALSPISVMLLENVMLLRDSIPSHILEGITVVLLPNVIDSSVSLSNDKRISDESSLFTNNDLIGQPLNA